MKNTLRAVLAAFAVFVALPTIAEAATPSSYETAWSNAMNQASYWNSALANEGRTVTCTKYSEHSGWIPAEYDAAVIKDGSSVVKVYPDLTNTGDFQATGAINPNNQKPYEAPHSWVMKCKFTPVQTTTTTTIPATTTTTTVPETTTTVIDTTTTAPTTTVAETTTTIAATTTVPATSSTTAPTSSVLNTVVTTTVPAATTTVVITDLPRTGFPAGWVAIGAAFAIIAGAAILLARRPNAA